jgi:exopolysaccharide biosynthesis polyprenyl glycosylphosphotransferase
MLRRDRQLRVQVNQLIDGGVFALGVYLAWAIRYYWAYFGPPWVKTVFGKKGVEVLLGTKEVASIFHSYGVDKIANFPDYFWLFLVMIFMTPVVLEWQGFYERLFFSPIRQMAWQLAKACTLCVVGLIVVDFMVKKGEPSARGVFVLFGFCSFGLMFLKEELIRVAYKTQLGQAQYKRRIILAGALKDTRRLQMDIGKWKEDLEVVGEFDLNTKPVEELVASLHEHSVNAVVIAARHTFFDRVEKAIRACELEGIESWLLADFFDTQISQTSLDQFYGRPVLVFRCGTENSWPRLMKQLIDFTGALAILAIWSLPMLAAALAIKLTSRGPVFFKQERAGLNGKPFVMYKFRSMVTNAEQLKQELERLNEMSGPVFKVTDDPRVTKVGHLLRKFSLDEFPQLFNVLRFEMSLVGPRPLPVDEVRRFDDVSHRRRLSVRPGLTCIWQVSGRNDVKDFNDWVRMDLEYIDNWSLWLDMKILWRTIWVVLLGTGGR